MSALKFYPVIVDNIAVTVEPHHLRSLFSNVGHVIDVVIVSNHGFVNMESVMDARDAINSINGVTLHNNLLHVDYSEELKQYLE